MNEEQQYFETNRSLWNGKTPHHIASAFYDMEGWMAGNTSLKGPELDILGDISNKTLLHLHCHFGQDSLSLARMGANVTGTDISDVAIQYARELNEQLGLGARFIEADTYSVPGKVGEQFDIVFATYGVIGWLPDMQRWADVVSSMLKPGGRLVFVEFHPAVWMFDNHFTHVQYSYFNRGPIIETLDGTYADRSAEIKMKEIGWNHSIADVLQSLINSGMQITVFKEYDYSVFNCFNNTVETAPGQWQIKGMEGKLPMMYALEAVKKG